MLLSNTHQSKFKTGQEINEITWSHSSLGHKATLSSITYSSLTENFKPPVA